MSNGIHRLNSSTSWFKYNVVVHENSMQAYYINVVYERLVRVKISLVNGNILLYSQCYLDTINNNSFFFC